VRAYTARFASFKGVFRARQVFCRHTWPPWLIGVANAQVEDEVFRKEAIQDYGDGEGVGGAGEEAA
jgi:hypothetical protein